MKGRTGDPWWDKPAQTVVAASMLFVFVHAVFRNRTDDPELLFLSFLDWCVLIAISVVPISGICLLIDRAPHIQRLIGEGSDMKRWILAGVAAIGFIPFWQVMWVSVVTPLESSAPWVGLLAWIGGSVLLALTQGGKSGKQERARAAGQTTGRGTRKTGRELMSSGRLPVGSLLLIGLTLFVVTRMFFPPLRAWPAGGTGTTPDSTPLMLGLVACLGWATLVAITVLPVIFVVDELYRGRLSRMLDLVGSGERARYLAKLTLSLTLSIPAWFLAWDHLVAPFWTSAVGLLAGTMFSTLAVVLVLAASVCLVLAIPALKQQSE